MRVVLRTLSALLGLVVAAVGALLLIEVVASWLRPAGSGLIIDWNLWRSSLDPLTWESAVVRIVAGVVATVGLALVGVALMTRGRDVELTAPGPDVTVVTSPRVLAELVRQRVREIDAVDRVSVSAKAHQITVRARGRDLPADAVLPLVNERVEAVIAALRLVREPRVSVQVDTPRTAE